MMNSVRDFTKNFKKYLIYIAVLAQLVFGTVYLVCNFSEYIIYPETEEMVHAARTLVFDEYIGFLYPLFIRVCLSIRNMCGVGYYLFVYGIQLFAMLFSVYYMVKPFFERKKAWIVAAYVMSIPMCMQTALMVSPFAFKTVFSFLIAGSMVRLWKDLKRVWIWAVMFGCFVLSVFNVPDDLFVWGVPIFVFSLVNCLRKSDKVHWVRRVGIVLVAVLVFAGAFVTVNGVTEAGSRGRMRKSVESVLFQRTVWPDLGVKYNFLPSEIRQYISQEDAFISDNSSEQILCFVGPTIERNEGTERAKELFLEAALQQLSYNKKELAGNISRDFTGYLLTPYSIVSYMQGENGSAYGTLYSRMAALNPQMTYSYFTVFFVSFFVLTFGAILAALKNNMLGNKNALKNVFAVILLLGYQALWYAIVNVQGVDYRYALFNAAVFTGVALKCFEPKTEQNAEEKEQKKKFPVSKKVIGITITVVACLGVSVGLLVMFFGNSHKVSDVLSGQKIVCFGDSIWGLVHDDTGIATRVESMTGATIYNYAVPGTAASDFDKASEENIAKWSLSQIVEGLRGENEAFMQDFKEMDAALKEADYLILAYGLNDYFQGAPAEAKDTLDTNTYEGALCQAVEFFRENYPDVQIVLIGQTYCQFYSYGIVEADSDTCSFGGGVGTDYVDVVQKIAQKYDLIFINMYREIPMNEWNGILYLEDATHLNQRGRLEYAKVVAETLVDDYKERNAQ